MSHLEPSNHGLEKTKQQLSNAAVMIDCSVSVFASFSILIRSVSRTARERVENATCAKIERECLNRCRTSAVVTPVVERKCPTAIPSTSLQSRASGVGVRSATYTNSNTWKYCPRYSLIGLVWTFFCCDSVVSTNYVWFWAIWSAECLFSCSFKRVHALCFFVFLFSVFLFKQRWRNSFRSQFLLGLCLCCFGSICLPPLS